MKRTTLALVACAVLAALWNGAAAPVLAAWDLETIAGPAAGGDAMLAHDASGQATVIYRNSNTLLLFKRTGSTWSAPVNVVSGYASIVGYRFGYNPAGVAGIAFTGQITSKSKRSLYFVDEVGGTWGTPELVATDRRLKTNRIRYSLAYDAAGDPAVVYSIRNTLYLARRSGSTWASSPILAANSGSPFSVGMAFDPADGQPVVAFGDEKPSTLDLVYTKHNGSNWATEVVATWPAGDNYREISVAFSPLTPGNAHIFAGHNWGGVTGAFQDKREVWERLAAGSWSLSFVAQGGQFLSEIVFNVATGEAHVAWTADYTYASPDGYHPTSSLVLYSKRAITGDWSSPEVVAGPEPQLAYRPSLALDGAGSPAVAFVDVADVSFFAYPAPCVVQVDCDDLNECTDDDCLVLEDVCRNTLRTEESSCTDGLCCAAVCTSATCQGDNDCNDSDICTDDSCSAPGTCTAACNNVFDETNDPSCEEECVPTASKEKGPRCSDGLDNDCDGLIDGDDPDC